MLLSTPAAILLMILSQLPVKRAAFAPNPPEPFTRFLVPTDNVPQATIAGVVMPATRNAKGTVFLLHGFGRGKEDNYKFERLRRELHWNLIAFDFREHGQSSRTFHLTTLGYHEIYDVKAVIDHAEKLGLAKPFVIYGSSMGGSVGLRWAANDPRISGVIAVSPYRNGYSAAENFFKQRLRLNVDLQGGWSDLLRAVDLPSDLSKRQDLRITILCGEFDIFRAADQRAILAGSKSPARLKKLFIIPGGYHSTLWRWMGNDRVPSHDQIVREFLTQCR